MAFPKYKIVKKLFWKMKIPDGWRHLGDAFNIDYPIKYHKTTHSSFCDSFQHVGEEDGKTFLFCPRCLVKTL